jgi:LacI family transcriptional regulator
MRVTARDIAKESGVSQPTVSQILNGKGHLYREETRRRVFEAAERLGYRPNTYARAMRSGRMGAIALLMSCRADRAVRQAGIQQGIHDELLQHDLLLTSANVPDEAFAAAAQPGADRTALPRLLRECNADGLLVAYSHDLPPGMQAAIDRDPMPAVWLNRKQELNAVHPDDLAGASAATAHLLGLGHAQIAFLQVTTTAHYSAADRLRGYREVMTAAGLAPQVVRMEGSELTWCAQVVAWLRRAGRPTAVVAASPLETQTLVMACAQAGVGIPGALSVVALSESALVHTGFDLTRVIVPFHDLGVHAVRMLLERIEREAMPLPALALPMSLHPGATAICRDH